MTPFYFHSFTLVSISWTTRTTGPMPRNHEKTKEFPKNLVFNVGLGIYQDLLDKCSASQVLMEHSKESRRIPIGFRLNRQRWQGMQRDWVEKENHFALKLRHWTRNREIEQWTAIFFLIEWLNDWTVLYKGIERTIEQWIDRLNSELRDWTMWNWQRKWERERDRDRDREWQRERERKREQWESWENRG